MNNFTRTTVALLALTALSAPAVAQDKPFYEGQTLNVIVGYSPGGSSDLACRIFANHIGKHIPGNPTIVVRNMPGASGLNAINYVGEAARKDGLSALCGTVNILIPLLQHPSLTADLTNFHFLLGIADSQVFFTRADTAPGVEKPADFMKATEIVFGGFTVEGSKDLAGRSYLDLLGLDYRYVTGIGTDSDGRTAVQQNFLNTWMEGLASYHAITHPTMTQTGETIALFQSGLLDENGNMTQRDAALPDVPTFLEYYAENVGGEPSGKSWDIVKIINGTYAASQRALSLPPEAPQAAVDAIAAAVEPLLADEAFWEEARRVLGAEVAIFGGDRLRTVYAETLNAPEETRQALRDMIDEGRKLTAR